jgi:hypothetical protein
MHRAFILGLFILVRTTAAQISGPGDAPTFLEPVSPQSPSPSPIGTSHPDGASSSISTSSTSTPLPDSPGVVAARQYDVVSIGKPSLKAAGKAPETCNAWHAIGIIAVDPNKVDEPQPPCSELVNPYQRFLDTKVTIPLNWQEKGYLALHQTTDPGSIGTIIGISAISIAVDSHSAYGPGLKGFGKLAGVSLLQNATGEFFGTFAIPSVVRQDPRYFRKPDAPFGKRLVYSISRSYISRSDSGKTIPNYGVLGAYPIVAVLSNLYVPGIESDGPSTAKRIATGLALDPVNNIVNEFLPDVAKRIHVRVIFVQQILNRIAVSPNGLP